VLESPMWIEYQYRNRPGVLPQSFAGKLEFAALLQQIFAEDDEYDKPKPAKDDWGGAKQW